MTSSARQTWWVAVKQADGTEAEPEVAQVWFNGTGVEEVLLLGNDCGLYAEDVRLIERVLPAWRAAAAVEKLRGAYDTRCGDDIWDIVGKAVAILQDGENRA